MTSVAAALAAPATALALFVAVAMQPPPTPALPADQALRNAGRVLNGRRLDAQVAEVVDRQLALRQPRVVVLGNSNANTDLQVRLLADHLGVQPADILVLSIPLSIGAHWYAILEQRVFGGGHRPDLIIVVSRLQLALWTVPLSEAGWVNLEAHLDGPHPLIRRLSGWRGPSWWRRLRAARARWREALVQAPRDTAIRWLFPDGPSLAEAAAALPTRPQSLAELRGLGARPELPAVDDSYLPPIADLAEAHGARLIVARPPIAPHVPDPAADRVPSQVADQVAGWAGSRGVVYADLAALPMLRHHYRNPTHLAVSGARRFTRALIAHLDDRSESGWIARLLGPSPPVGTAPPGQAEVRAGPPPTLSVGDLEADGPAGSYLTASLSDLSGPATANAHASGTPCSPLQVWADDEALAAVPCAMLHRQDLRGQCHEGPRVQFRLGGGQPIVGTASYGIGLRADRRCDGALWVYPGDRIALQWPLAPRPGPATRLSVAASVRGPGSGRLEVQLWADGRQLIHSETPTSELDPRRREWDLAEELPHDASARLVVHADRDFVLITEASLRGDATPQAP